MNLPLSDKISLEQLTAIELPVDQATGMPNAAYTDKEFFYFERDNVLGTGWAALGFSDDHVEKGTVTPVEFMGLPLLIATDKAGKIKVFHNVCSHRGRKLVDEKKKTNGMVVCPYHSWSYDLGGKLRVTPHIGGIGQNSAEGFCKEKHGLKEVRSHVWLNIIFINLSGDAEDFTDYAEPLLDRYHGFVAKQDLDQICYSRDHGNVEFSIACNWKLALENYCEAYHVPWIHPALSEISPLEDHYPMFIGDSFAGQRSEKFISTIQGCIDLPRFPSWAEEQVGCAEYPTFYPNLMLGFQENHIFALIAIPVDTDRTEETVRLFYINEEVANGEKYKATRCANQAAWKQVFAEDVTSVEGMQKGRSSPGYGGGAFSPFHDPPTLHFHQWLSRKYQTGYSSLGLV